MRKIKDILRLKWAHGLSNRQVAVSCGVARSTVAETVYRAKAAGLVWQLPKDLGDAQVEAQLYLSRVTQISPLMVIENSPPWLVRR
jgi:DNA-binding transcriptional regulator LsrR (DeoR family)